MIEDEIKQVYPYTKPNKTLFFHIAEVTAKW